MKSNEDVTNVLMAEDDDDDYFIFQEAIENISVKIELRRAENGEILLKVLDEEHTDMLFLDMMMPCKDGKECLKEIRANKKYDALPIIVYSSMSDLRNIEFCYRNGANIYAVKPVALAELKEILEKIFSVDWKKVLYYPPLSNFVLNPQ